jgi:hypothetical protein
MWNAVSNSLKAQNKVMMRQMALKRPLHPNSLYSALFNNAEGGSASSTKFDFGMMLSISAIGGLGSMALYSTSQNERQNKWDLKDKSQCSMEDFLYPKISPYKTGRLQVSKTHNIYYEECGNPNGKPVVLVHGGPGGGCTPTMNRYHDPKIYRIIAFDQRGAGRSTPHACLEDNTYDSTIVQ